MSKCIVKGCKKKAAKSHLCEKHFDEILEDIEAFNRSGKPKMVIPKSTTNRTDRRWA